MAALEADVLPEMYRKEIQSRIMNADFKDNLVRYVLSRAGTLADVDDFDIVSVMSDLKGLIIFFRQHRARTA